MPSWMSGPNHLRRADEVKTRFLSNMSHEFRTAAEFHIWRLNAAACWTGWTAELGAEQERQVYFVRKSARESFGADVNDLLDLANSRSRQAGGAPVGVLRRATCSGRCAECCAPCC